MHDIEANERIWADAADSLKSAIQNQAIAEFLANKTPAEVMVAAGDKFPFQGFSDKFQIAIIATLAHQLRNEMS